ncbi:MAG: transglutaminase domain-containing protein, partial [Myxococcales bacterium]
MRLALQHRSRYVYPRPTILGPHVVRLRPAPHARAHVESYALRLSDPAEVRWQYDPAGNHVARATWAGVRLPALEVAVDLSLELTPVNPFDFSLDPFAQQTPFSYGPLSADLAPYLGPVDGAFACAALAEQFFAALPRAGATVPLLTEINRAVHERIRYVTREEAGIWTPEETLREARGSCRDSAVLLVAALRSRGLAARFVSGYLVQLADSARLPDQATGVPKDVLALHAWAEVFLPGAGWMGLDATSGLFCGEGHIPLACSAVPALAAAVEGTSDVAAGSVSFEMEVRRLADGDSPVAVVPGEPPSFGESPVVESLPAAVQQAHILDDYHPIPGTHDELFEAPGRFRPEFKTALATFAARTIENYT